jgi:hypothetical protein
MRTNSPDRLNLRVLFAIAVLGAILALVGWLRYLGIV